MDKTSKIYLGLNIQVAIRQLQAEKAWLEYIDNTIAKATDFDEIKKLWLAVHSLKEFHSEVKATITILDCMVNAPDIDPNE